MAEPRRKEHIPPRIASTALLPVLIAMTFLRLSATSTPVENEEPYRKLDSIVTSIEDIQASS